MRLKPITLTFVLCVGCASQVSAPQNPEPSPGGVLGQCGDGIREGEEQCDDGNISNSDGCLNVCRLARCGDGVVRTELSESGLPYEACDQADRNGLHEQGCQTGCRCPDGWSIGSNGCLPPGDCHEATGSPCGDCGVFDCGGACVGEQALNACGQCGSLPSGYGDSCGCDGLIDCFGRCVGDTCSQCGDGEVDEEEDCDDGNQIDSDACTSFCEPARCGDGLVHEGVEACDDGNLVATDACRSDCQPMPRTVTTGMKAMMTVALTIADRSLRRWTCLLSFEDCDDGNEVVSDGCTNDCQQARCGDGILRTDLQEGEVGFVR